jgi:hypothetical protein
MAIGFKLNVVMLSVIMVSVTVHKVKVSVAGKRSEQSVMFEGLGSENAKM